MPYDPHDYSKPAVIACLEHAKQVYENARNEDGAFAASVAISNAEADTDEGARQIEIEFNNGDFGNFGGDLDNDLGNSPGVEPGIDGDGDGGMLGGGINIEDPPVINIPIGNAGGGEAGPGGNVGGIGEGDEDDDDDDGGSIDDDRRRELPF